MGVLPAQVDFDMPLICATASLPSVDRRGRCGDGCDEVRSDALGPVGECDALSQSDDRVLGGGVRDA
jgi:hypothetical protein